MTPSGLMSWRLGWPALIGLVVRVVAACSVSPAPPASNPSQVPPSAFIPTLVPGAPSPSSIALTIVGLKVDCGPLAESDCRSVVDAFGPIADGATVAELRGSMCDGDPCPSVAVGSLDTAVILRWGEGDLTKILTCTRSTAGDPVQCERAPLDLG